MNVQQLLNDIQSVAGPNGSQKDVDFVAMFDMGVFSSEDDQNKQINLRFKDCIVSSRHPNKIQITLV